MDMFFYNKSGRVAAFIARDCIILSPGDRMPTISEYCDKFNVSRGIVQNALSFLQEEGAILTETGGAKGTHLTKLNMDKLVEFSGWDSVSVSMALPFEVGFASLSTAINECLEGLPLPTAFAYVTGSSQRMSFLRRKAFDVAVFSLSTANYYSELHKDYSLPIVLKDCVYAHPFVFYIKKEFSGIEAGMRMVYDSISHDQNTLTKQLASAKQVEYVDYPYVSFEDILTKDIGDFIAVRNEPWTKELLNKGFKKYNVSDKEPYSIKNTSTPALLTHKDNYGMYELLLHYLDFKKLATIQQEVLKGTRPPRYY